MIFIGIGGVFLFTDRSPASQAVITPSEPSTMDKMVTALTSSKSMSVGGEFDISQNEENWAKISLDVDLNMLDGFNELSIQGNLGISKQDSRVDINFVYVDNQVYLSMLGAKMVVNTADFSDLVGLLSSLIKTVVPEFDLSSMLDLAALMDLMNGLQETQGEDNITLTLPTDLGDIRIVTDLDYKIKEISIPNIKIDTLLVVPQISLSTFDEFQNIAEPSDPNSYDNISEEINLLKAVINTLSNNFVAQGSYTDFNLSMVKLNNDIDLGLNYNDYNLDLTLYQNIGYLSFGDLKVKADESDINNMIDYVTNLIGFDREIDVEKVLYLLLDKFKSLDFNNIDLSQITNYIKADEKGNYHILIDDFDITVEVVDNRLTQIYTQINNDYLQLQFEYVEGQIDTPEGNYIVLSTLVNQVEAVINTFTSNAMNLKANIAYKNINAMLNADYSYDNGNIYVNANILCQDLNINLIFDNNLLYLSYQGVKIKADKTTLDLLLSYLEGQGDKSTKEIILLVVEFLDNLTLDGKENIITLVNGDFNLEITTLDKKINNILGKYKDLNINTEFSYNNFDKAIVNDADYSNANDIIYLVDNTYQLIENGFTLEVLGTYQDLSVSGAISYVENILVADLNVAFNDIGAKVRVLDNIVYVDILGAKVKFNLSDIDKVLNSLENMGIIEGNLQTFDINQIIKLIASSYIEYNNGTFTLTLDDLLASIVTFDNCITDINLSYLDANVSMQVKEEIINVSIINSQDYLDLITVLPMIESAYNTYNQNNIYGSAVLKFDLNSTQYTVDVNFAINMQDKNVWALVNYKDLSMELYYSNKTIYIALENIYIKANVQDLDKLTDYFSANLNADEKEIIALIKEVLNVLNIQDLSFVNSINANDNNLSMNLGNGRVYVEFADVINYASVDFNSLNLNTNISNIKLEIALTQNGVHGAKPNGDYVDINDLLTVVDKAINTFKNTLSGEIVVNIYNDDATKILGTNQLNISYNYAYLNDKINFNLSTTILGDALNVVFKDNTLYLDYQGIKVYSSINDLMGLLPSENTLDLESTIISIIKNVTLNYTNGNLIVGIDNVSFTFVNSEKLLSRIELNSEFVDLSMTINSTSTYDEPILTGDYVEIKNIYELINNAIDVLSGNIYAQFSANLFSYEIIGAINYQDNSLNAQLNTKIANKNVEIKLIDKVIYINFDGLKLKFAINDIDRVVDLLKKYDLINDETNISIDDNIINKILNNIYLTYDGNKIQASLDYNLQDFNIDLNDIDLVIGGIDLSALQENQLNVIVDGIGNKLNGLNVNIGDSVSVELLFYGNAQKIDDNTSGYLDIIKLMPFVEPFISAYLSNGINGQISVNIPELESAIGRINVDYKVNFNAGLRVNLSTNIMNLPVEIDIANNNIYIKIDGAKYYFAFDELQDLLSFIEEKFSVDLGELNLNDFSFGNIKIEVLNDKELQIQINDIVLYIVNDSGLSLALDYNGIDAQVTINEGLNSYNALEDDYLHIDSLLNKVGNVYDIIQSGDINLSIATSIENEPIEILLSLSFKEYLNTLDLNDLKLDAEIYALDKTIYVKLLNGTIYVSVEGLNVKFNLNDIDTIIAFVNDNITEISLPSLELDLQTLINSLFATNNKIEITLNNIGNIAISFINEQLSSIDFVADTFNANIAVISDKIDVILQNSYSNVVDLLPVADKIVDIYNSKKLSLDMLINTQILGNNQEIGMSANIDFADSLNVDLHLELEGVNVNVYLRNDILYLDIYGLRIKLTEQDIITIATFVNDNFNTNLVVPNASDKKGVILLDFINSNFNLNIDTNFDLSMIGAWTLSNSILNWTLGNGANINLDVSNLIDIKFAYNDTNINAEISAVGEAVILQTFDRNQYVKVQEILSAVQAIINTLNTKEYGLIANAQVYNNDALRFDASVNANLSIIDGIYFSGSAVLAGESDIAVNIDYDNEYFYLDYDGLKVKINKQNLLEIAGIVLSVFGIDISGLEIFEDIDLDFNLDNLEQIMPNIDFGNPLSLLQIINSLSYENGQFNLALNGSFITGDDSTPIMNVAVVTSNDGLQSVDLKGIYTSTNEYFDLQILFNEFAGINVVEGNYIDISSASTLIKAIINTSELTNYHITGTANIIMDVLGVNIDWDVPYDIQVKLVEGKPIIKASIGPMPVVPAVNNDVPYKFGDTVSGIYCGLNRVLNIYYMDGYVYFHRTEEIPVFASSNRTYEKKLKVSLDAVLEDPMAYLQYGLGLTDTIMDAIADAMALAQNREEPIDLGNILLSYDYSNGYYNLTINLEELSNNPQLDTMTVNIKTSYVESAEKDYTTDLKFNLHAPFTDSIIMDLTTEDMKLVDIGVDLDFSDLYDFINSYTYNEDEQWEASNGSWTLASAKTYTISFVANGGSDVGNITQSANTTITLPTYSDRLVDDGDTRYTYRFDGWYTTENFTEGTEFTQNTMPRGDVTLYAKWTLVSTTYTRTITFNSNGGSAVNDLKFIAGSTIDLSGAVPTKDTTYVDKGYNWIGSNVGKWTYEVTTYTFAGWYLDSSCTNVFNGIMPDYNITLYAKWTSNTTTEYYYNWERP